MTTPRKRTDCYAVVVLGAGPAGSATALKLLARNSGLPVLLVERSDFDRLRIGEALHPGVEASLRELGAWDAFLKEPHLPAYGTRAVWGSDEPIENEFLFHRNRRGWHLDRARFDATLACLAEVRGADLLTASRLYAHERLEDGWRLTFDSSGDRWTCEAAFVIDATGRCATFAREQGARKVTMDQLAGLFAIGALRADAQIDSYTLVEAWEEGWWYSSLLPENRIVFALMTDSDVVRKNHLVCLEGWLAAASRCPHTGARLSQAELEGPPILHAAASHRLEPSLGDGWLAVGDAALALDPLSSGGIQLALRSGMFAARAVEDFLRGNSSGLAKYRSFLAAEHAGYLMARTDVYGQEARFAGSAFWERRRG